MRILHACFSRGPGGIEQAFLSMDSLLRELGHEVLTITQPDSWLAGKLPHSSNIPNRLGNWDWFAVRAIRKHIKKHKADIVIVHGNRAINLSHCAKGKVPLVAIQHRYRFGHLHKADAIYCISHTLLSAAAEAGIARDKLFYLPNILTLPSQREKPYHTPPVIGFLGRFVPEKGLSMLLEAAYILKEKHFPFRVRLGGEGPVKDNLLKLTEEYGLADIVEFTGWVEQPEMFFSGIDIFCLPSLSESFGLVILEAFASGVPVIATRTQGPAELIQPEKNGLLVAPDDARSLAEALALLLKDEAYATRLAQQARLSLQPFTREEVGKTLSGLLAQTFKANQRA